MAKELPYFKFEPSEWLEGEIQILSDEAVVCFMNLCSSYWLRLGNMSYAFALQKHCRRSKDVIQELINSNVIKLNNDKISIIFLDEQLKEFSETSNKRREAANERWKKKNKNANAMQVQSKSNAIREDKIREDKNKTTTKEVEADFDNLNTWLNNLQHEQMYLEAIYRTTKLKKGSISKLGLLFIEHLKIYPKKHKNFSDFKKHLASWIKQEIAKGNFKPMLKEVKGQL